jgi:hypothetical protein
MLKRLFYNYANIVHLSPLFWVLGAEEITILSGNLVRP